MSTLREIGHRLARGISHESGIEVTGSGGPMDDTEYELDVEVDQNERVLVTLRRLPE